MDMELNNKLPIDQKIRILTEKYPCLPSFSWEKYTQQIWLPSGTMQLKIPKAANKMFK